MDRQIPEADLGFSVDREAIIFKSSLECDEFFVGEPRLLRLRSSLHLDFSLEGMK